MGRDRFIETRDDLGGQIETLNMVFSDALNRPQQDAELLAEREKRSVVEIARDAAFSERDREVSALAEMQGLFDEAVTPKSVLPEGLMSTTTSRDQLSARITCDSAALPSGERTTQRARRLLNNGIRRIYRRSKSGFPYVPPGISNLLCSKFDIVDFQYGSPPSVLVLQK